MTPSSSDFPTHPVKLEHAVCGNTWEMYAIEWPPKIIVCPKCHVVLTLVDHNKQTHRLAYRHI